MDIWSKYFDKHSDCVEKYMSVCGFTFRSARLWRRMILSVYINLPEEMLYPYRGLESVEWGAGSLYVRLHRRWSLNFMGRKLRTWRWRRRVHPTHWNPPIMLHRLITETNTTSTLKPRKPENLYFVWLFCNDIAICVDGWTISKWILER
jgi:hypothetical protein